AGSVPDGRPLLVQHPSTAPGVSLSRYTFTAWDRDGSPVYPSTTLFRSFTQSHDGEITLRKMDDQTVSASAPDGRPLWVQHPSTTPGGPASREKYTARDRDGNPVEGTDPRRHHFTQSHDREITFPKMADH